MLDTALTTVSDVKEKLRLTTADDDAFLQRLILAVSQRIRTETGRDFDLTTYTAALNGTGTEELLLPQYPVVAVTSVAVGWPGTALAAFALNTGYLFDEDGLIAVTGVWPRGFQNVAVTWQAGYEATPWDLADACAKWTATTYRENERMEVQSKIVGGETVAFRLAEMPMDVAGVINNYRGWGR